MAEIDLTRTKDQEHQLQRHFCISLPPDLFILYGVDGAVAMQLFLLVLLFFFSLLLISFKCVALFINLYLKKKIESLKESKLSPQI